MKKEVYNDLGTARVAADRANKRNPVSPKTIMYWEKQLRKLPFAERERERERERETATETYLNIHAYTYILYFMFHTSALTLASF